jgi:hypothetical protein
LRHRKTQDIIAVIVILLALLGLLFQDQIWNRWEEYKIGSDPRPSIAEITSLNRGVKYRLPESLTYRRARKSMPLHAKDTVLTEADSSAIITFKSGLKVELEPNSLIIIEEYGSGPGAMELTFLRGRVKILDQGKGIKLSGAELNKDQALKQPVKIDFSVLEKAPTPPPVALNTMNLEEKKERLKELLRKKKAEKETLPDSYIASVIRNQKTFLNRCYAQHLRLNPDARGRIDTSLTIESDGSISSARVIGSTIPDPILQQCVVTTLQRARFKSFNGDPIIVAYPINFE